MTIYYDKENKCFYDSEINETMPEGSIEITLDQYNALLKAINNGCIIFDDLTYSEAKPSRFHSWDGEKWILDETKQNQHYITIAQSEKDRLINEAEQTILYLNNAVKTEIATDKETLLLQEYQKYHVFLNRIDVNDAPNIEWPKKPN